MSERIEIAKLNTIESKQLMLINASLHYDNPKNVKRLYDHIEKNSFFNTYAGLVYREALKRFIDGDNPTECIYCGQPLQEDYYLICKSCNDQLIQKAADAMDEVAKKEKNKKQSKSSEKTGTKNKNSAYIPRENWILKVAIGIVTLLIILAIGIGIWSFYYNKKADTNQKENQIAISKEIKASERSDRFDGFDLLGMKYDALEPILGSSEEVVDATTRYFKTCGISVVYDASTGVIKYIDNDGTGDGSSIVPIFGILPGADYEDARNVFVEKGIETVDFADDSFMCMFQLNSDQTTTYEIDVTKDDKGLVALVAARIVY